MAGSRGRLKRPKMTTKEELIAYLEANPDKELPFNEKVWEIAVEKTKDKERQFKELSTTDFDGTTKTKKIPNGAVNPVSKYFQLIALPNFKNLGRETEVEENNEEDGFDDLQGYSVGNEEQLAEFEMWFSFYKPNEKKILLNRIKDFYNTHEIGDGTDKFIFKQMAILELELMKLNQKLAKGNDVYMQLEKVTKQYLSLSESAKALKKQRSAMEEEGKNKFALWIDDMDKKGDFNPKDLIFETDEIDDMLKAISESMRTVTSEG